MKEASLFFPFIFQAKKIKIKVIKISKIFIIFSFLLSFSFLFFQLLYYLNSSITIKKYYQELGKMERENKALEIELTKRISLEKLEDYLLQNSFVPLGKIKVFNFSEEMAGSIKGSR